MRHLLVVDDEPDILAMLVSYLGPELGIPIEGVSNVDDAILACRADAPVAILSDYRMPGRSGLDLLAAVRRDGQKMPFVLLTGYPDAQVQYHAQQANAVLQKPVEPEQLAATIRGLLAGA